MRSFLRITGIIVARIAYAFGVRKKVTLDNLKHAYPEYSISEQEEIAKKSYHNLGIVFSEMLYLRFANLKNISQHIIVSNPKLFQDRIRDGKGLIVVSAHFANWEWLALGGSLILDTNFTIVRKNISTSFTERFLEKMRIRSGNKLKDAGDIRGMYRVINSGGCIALLADQAAPGKSTRINFFGREVPTFEGPARLALRTKAPMLFAECLREQNGDYTITFYSIPHDDLVGDAAGNIHELTYRHAHLLETIIRKHPDQWLWQHRRWKYI